MKYIIVLCLYGFICMSLCASSYDGSYTLVRASFLALQGHADSKML